jgi:hypothetical protein
MQKKKNYILKIKVQISILLYAHDPYTCTFSSRETKEQSFSQDHILSGIEWYSIHEYYAHMRARAHTPCQATNAQSITLKTQTSNLTPNNSSLLIH